MPLGIISDEEFESELLDSSVAPPIIEGEVINMPSPGRSVNDNNVPESLRNIIGETANIEGRQDALALAKQFGISPSSVSAYTNGSTSTSSMNKRPGLFKINEAKTRVAVKAKNKLVKALNSLTDDKLEQAKAVDLASIARSMSGIIKDMEPSEDSNPNEQNRPQFVVYAPTIKQENHYETIHARDMI